MREALEALRDYDPNDKYFEFTDMVGGFVMSAHYRNKKNKETESLDK